MTHMIPRFQEPADLWLVVASERHLGPLTILQGATVCWQDYEIAFHVLAESHEVILRRNGRIVLHELLSCVGVAPDAWPAHRHSFGDGLSHSYSQDGYSVHVTVADVPEGGIVPLNPNLYVAFPNVVGGDVTPFTSIQWDPGDEELVWRTIHLYALPERVVGVFSTSRVVRAAEDVVPDTGSTPVVSSTGRDLR